MVYTTGLPHRERERERERESILNFLVKEAERKEKRTL
jgi:hypothetical protein